MNKLERIRWVDIFKGILIVLMVFAHTPTMFVPYIYAFHMAAFFFISGYTQNYDKDEFITFLTKKFKSLMIPFFKVNVIFIVLILSLKVFGIYDLYYDPGYSIHSLINVFKYLNNSDLGGTTWFFIVLFTSTVSLKIMNDIVKTKFKKNHDEIKLVITGVLLLIAYFFYYVNKEQLQFFIDLIPLAMFFLEVGNYLKNKKININKYIKVIGIIILVCGYVYFTKFRYTHVEWPSRTFPNIIKLMIMSFSGILITYLISKLIEKLANTKFEVVIKVIEYLGKNTLPIMVYHFLGFRIFFTILYLMGKAPIEQLKSLIPLYNKVGLCLITTTFAILFSLGIDYISKNIKKIILKS